MNATMTLSALTALTGLDVFDYLDQEVSIPVVDGLQAQGDLIVIPYSLSPASSRPPRGRGRRTYRSQEWSCCAALRVGTRTAWSPSKVAARGRRR